MTKFWSKTVFTIRVRTTNLAVEYRHAMLKVILRSLHIISVTSFIGDILLIFLYLYLHIKDPIYVYQYYALMGALASTIIFLFVLTQNTLKRFSYLGQDLFYFCKPRNWGTGLRLQNNISISGILFTLCWLGYWFLLSYVS